jgi:hypothetical protein
MLSQDPPLAAGAHELIGEAEEVIRTGQQRVRAALQGIGATSDISETGSVDLLGLRDLPVVGRAFPDRETLPTAAPIERRPQVTASLGKEMANLI